MSKTIAWSSLQGFYVAELLRKNLRRGLCTTSPFQQTCWLGVSPLLSLSGLNSWEHIRIARSGSFDLRRQPFHSSRRFDHYRFGHFEDGRERPLLPGQAVPRVFHWLFRTTISLEKRSDGTTVLYSLLCRTLIYTPDGSAWRRRKVSFHLRAVDLVTFHAYVPWQCLSTTKSLRLLGLARAYEGCECFAASVQGIFSGGATSCNPSMINQQIQAGS